MLFVGEALGDLGVPGIDARRDNLAAGHVGGGGGVGGVLQTRCLHPRDGKSSAQRRQRFLAFDRGVFTLGDAYASR